MRVVGRSWVCEKMGKKMEKYRNGVMGRPAVVVGGGAKVLWW